MRDTRHTWDSHPRRPSRSRKIIPFEQALLQKRDKCRGWQSRRGAFCLRSVSPELIKLLELPGFDVMAKAIRLAIKAGQHSRQGCPVCVDLPLESNNIVLRDETGQTLPAQVVHRGDSGCRIAWILDNLAAHSEREYALEISKSAAAERVQVRDNRQGAVEILIDGELFTTYRYLGNPARPCFFPVVGPDKANVTRSWPLSDDLAGESRDHPHHRSLWVAHGSVNGVDNWSEDPGHGYQLHRAFTCLESGPVLGIMEAKNDWTDADKKKIC